ncbi:MAG: class I tRNA ligase family protein, partial [Nocardioides sp.]
MTYPKVSTSDDAGVPSSPKFPALEERVLAYWEADGTFQASIDAREAGEDGANEFVFYDGPPFANGLPHYGHLLTGYVKDIVPRYQTMRGKRVERRFGWDTHGLPAELEAMRLGGIKTTDEILEMGIDKFNEACRASVLNRVHRAARPFESGMARTRFAGERRGSGPTPHHYRAGHLVADSAVRLAPCLYPERIDAHVQLDQGPDALGSA